MKPRGSCSWEPEIRVPVLNQLNPLDTLTPFEAEADLNNT
jgi:hypothetical protein